jgi:dienelactone hydrolase
MISMFHRRVGDPQKDHDFLWSRSPLSVADKIRIPLLIAQGANHPRKKQAESEQIVAALEQHGVEYDYMLFPDEGHGFAKTREPAEVLCGSGQVPESSARRTGGQRLVSAPLMPAVARGHQA